jgi:hypothetical protein
MLPNKGKEADITSNNQTDCPLRMTDPKPTPTIDASLIVGRKNCETRT